MCSRVDVALVEDLQGREQLGARPVRRDAPRSPASPARRRSGCCRNCCRSCSPCPRWRPRCRAGRRSARPPLRSRCETAGACPGLPPRVGRVTASVEVVPDRARELGLRTIQFDDARQVLDVVERAAQRGLADACRARGGAEVRDPACEPLRKLRFCGRRGARAAGGDGAVRRRGGAASQQREREGHREFHLGSLLTCARTKGSAAR